MRTGDLVSRILFCLLAVLLAAATLHAQNTANTTTAATSTTTSQYGTLFKLQLKAAELKSVTVSQPPPVTITGSSQCPGIGTAKFPLYVSSTDVPVNDDTKFFDGVHAAPVLEITHHRVINSSCTAPIAADGTCPGGNMVVLRQDWTRIKENDNGIDNVTGVRHYIGNFGEETQIPNGGPAVVTAESQGELTLLEPLFFSSGPLVGVASRVNVVQFIGPQASWLEPFQVADTRQCLFLSTGTVRPINPFYNDNCVVNSSQSITYHGVTFTGNIVGCQQSTWP